MKQALQNINSVTEHANRAAGLLKAYKSKNYRLTGVCDS